MAGAFFERLENLMSIVFLVLIIAALGIGAYLMRKVKIIDPLFRLIIQIILIVIAILVALQAFGILDSIRGAKVPRITMV